MRAAHAVEGVPVCVYGVAKTVADCFKCRNKIDTDIAVEALRDCLEQRRCTADELSENARVCATFRGSCSPTWRRSRESRAAAEPCRLVRRRPLNRARERRQDFNYLLTRYASIRAMFPSTPACSSPWRRAMALPLDWLSIR